MSLTRNERLAVKAKLQMGATIQETAAAFDITEGTVYSINRHITSAEAQDDKLADEIKEIPIEVVAHVVKESKEAMEASTKPAAECMPLNNALDMVAEAAGGIKVLDMCYQTILTKGLNRMGEILDDPDTQLKEIKLCLDTISSSYEKVFNSGTNIHIGDNNSHSSQNLTVFKKKQGV